MDRAAVQDMYEKNGGSLYRLCCFYMKNEQDALDAMQNTFIKLMEHEPEFLSDEHAKNWLLKVAANECKNMLRHWWRRNVDIDECMPYLRSNDVESTAEAVMDRRVMLEEIMKLPKNSRLSLYLFYYEGYSTTEIAKILALKESSVRSALFRGRQKLKITMEGEGNE